VVDFGLSDPADGSPHLEDTGIRSKISLAETLACVAVILFGPAVGTLTAALDGLTSSLRTRGAKRQAHIIIFNIAAMSLSVFLAGQVFFVLLGKPPIYMGSGVTISEMMAPAVVMALTHFAINSVLVATVLAFEMRMSVYRIWRDN